jgi:hypothetical protein
MGLTWCVLGNECLATDACSDINVRSSHTRNQSLLALAYSSPFVPRRSFSYTFFDSDIWQAVKDVSASNDVLLDLFERMDDFFKRFKVYSQSVRHPDLAEILVKAMVKVLKILSIATKEVKKSRTSEFFLSF